LEYASGSQQERDISAEQGSQKQVETEWDRLLDAAERRACSRTMRGAQRPDEAFEVVNGDQPARSQFE
jgi:hypothetical protein